MNYDSVINAPLCIAAVVLVAGTISTMTGLPSTISPAPLCTVIPAFLVAATPLNDPDVPGRLVLISLAAAAPITVLSFVWSVICLRADAIPATSQVALLLVTILSAVYFVGGFEYARKYQGIGYYTALLSINFAVAAVLLRLIYVNRKTPKRLTNMAFHALFFVWLAWSAFPWIGETP